MRRVPRPKWNRRNRDRRGDGYRHQQLAKKVKAEAQGRCAWAQMGGCHGPLEADHIIPVAWGGLNVIENYRALCQRHNRWRGGKTRRIQAMR